MTTATANVNAMADLDNLTDKLFQALGQEDKASVEAAENIRFFNSLQDITTEDIQWLKDGSYHKGAYIHNPRTLRYTTKRGVRKEIKCYVRTDGTVSWRSWSEGSFRANRGLTNEEARVFTPELMAERDARKAARAAEAEEIARDVYKRPVKVGDIFIGSFGYEALVHRFYEVIAVSASGKTVTVRELRQETRSSSLCGPCEWECRPVPGSYASAPRKHRVTWSVDRKSGCCALPEIHVRSYEWGYLLEDATEWHDAYNYH